MQFIFGVLYTFLFFTYVATGLFIVYHLLRYSLNRKLGFICTIFFSSVLTILLFTNAFLFLTIPWGNILPAQQNAAFGL